MSSFINPQSEVQEISSVQPNVELLMSYSSYLDGVEYKWVVIDFY